MSVAGSYEERPDVLAYKVQQQGRRLEKVEEWRRDVDGERSARGVEMKDLHDDMDDLKALVMRVIWALVGLTLTIAGSSAALVLTIGAGH